jgi:hypothetical protein
MLQAEKRAKSHYKECSALDRSFIVKKILISLVLATIITFFIWIFAGCASLTPYEQDRYYAIDQTLTYVKKNFKYDRYPDITGDGKANCQDATLMFYLAYPYPGECRIMTNSTTDYGNGHAFVAVKWSNDEWICVEPQAYAAGWGYGKWGMKKIWGSWYEPEKNLDSTFEYLNRYWRAKK